MKMISPILLACVLAMPSFADDAGAKAAAQPGSTTNKMMQPVQTFPVSAAELSKPFLLTNGFIVQMDLSEVADGGKAVFNFAVTNAGAYVIKAVVNAPADDANSFYVNVDAAPEDPMMIWDIDVTSGFEERTVSWRGNGDGNNDEFVPKRFNLSVGAHKLILVGREPGTELKSISIVASADR